MSIRDIQCEHCGGLGEREQWETFADLVAPKVSG
jgi:hypothetical protein